MAAEDAAGNAATRTVTYVVLFRFGGFQDPVSNPSALNIVNAGSAIPLKWTLLDAAGNAYANMNSLQAITSKLLDVAGVRRAVPRARVDADVVALAGADEKRDLEPGGGPELCHLAELRLAQEHRAAALRDAVDDDPLRLGGAHDLVENSRALDARDLDPEVGAVGEAGRGHRVRL